MEISLVFAHYPQCPVPFYTTVHLVVMAVEAPLSVAVSQTVLLLMTLAILRITGQVLCDMPLHWNLVFLVMIRVGSEFLGGRNHRGKLLFITSSAHTINMTISFEVLMLILMLTLITLPR